MTVYRTSGNPFGHVILRGGDKGPNFDAESVDNACKQLAEFGLPQRLIVDFSHANCQKQHRKQLEVAQDICEQIKSGKTKLPASWQKALLLKATSLWQTSTI